MNLNARAYGTRSGCELMEPVIAYVIGYRRLDWISAAGGSKDEAVVFVHGDLGDAKTPTNHNRYAALMTAGRMQRDVQRWSRVYGGPYIAIGRLGAFGSSGDHRKRRSLLEIRVVMAALDELKVR